MFSKRLKMPALGKMTVLWEIIRLTAHLSTMGRLRQGSRNYLWWPFPEVWTVLYYAVEMLWLERRHFILTSCWCPLSFHHPPHHKEICLEIASSVCTFSPQKAENWVRWPSRDPLPSQNSVTLAASIPDRESVKYIQYTTISNTYELDQQWWPKP